MAGSRLLRWLTVTAAVLLAACSSDPRNALEAAVQRLEEGITERQTARVMALLHEDFEGSHGLRREQARQQLRAMFLRYQHIGVLVTQRECRPDAGFHDRARCSARVGISGAQGLIPERAELYRVDSLWELQGKDWLLRELYWE